MLRGILLLAAVTGAGCGDDHSEAPPILVRLMADLSGPTRFVGEAFHAGRVDHLEDINARGGIQGRRIEYEVTDTRYDPNKAIQDYLLWKSSLAWSDVVTVFGYGSEETAVLSDRLKKAGMPYFSKSCAGSLASPRGITRVVELEDQSIKIVENPGSPNVFIFSMDYSSAARAAIDFIASTGGRSIAFAHCSGNRYCTEPVEAAAPYARGKYEMDIAEPLLVEYTDTREQVFSKVQNYLAAHELPSWIWLGNTHTTAAYIIEALRDEDVRFMANKWAMSEELDKATGGAARGKVYGTVAGRPFGDMLDSPVMPDLVAAYNRAHENDELANVYYVMGFASVAIWDIAVERLVASGRTIDRQSIEEELEQMDKVNTGGLLKPVSYSPEDHRPAMRTDIYKIAREGNFEITETVEIERSQKWLGW